MDTLLTAAQIVLAVIAGGIVALNVIAPLTKTSKDDTVLTWLQRIELALRKLLVPTPSPAVAKQEKVTKDLRSI